MSPSIPAVSAQAHAGIGDRGIGLGNTANAGDVLPVLGTAVFGGSILGQGLTELILMVLSSAAALTLTTILPTGAPPCRWRVFRAIPSQFKRIRLAGGRGVPDRRRLVAAHDRLQRGGAGLLCGPSSSA